MSSMQKNKFIYILIFLIFLTSSFDIFLTVDVFGFTFRISQIFCIALMIIYLCTIIKRGKMILPLGYKNLLIWVAMLVAVTFNTALPSINIGYHLWLIFDILIIFCLTQLIEDKEANNKILKLYILSFFIMAIVGIIEFIIGVMGIKIPFITQWWIDGKFPRINGFSFEPSYYATYLLLGWVFCRVLVERNIKICKNLFRILITITIAIILSSSRMGIAMIAIFEVIMWLKNLFRGTNKKYVQIMFIIGVITVIIIGFLFQQGKLDRILFGTGLNGTASHSVTIRENDLLSVWEVFKQSPIVGRGLGGIYVQIAENRGFDIYNVSVQSVATGISVFLEVLAASGIIAFIFFILYMLNLIVKPLKLNKRNIEQEHKDIMNALVLSFIMEIIILQFNQNILRIYFWIHIAVLCMYFRYITTTNNEQTKKEKRKN